MVRLTRHGLWEIIIGTVVLLAIGWGLSWVWWPLGFLVLPVIIWLFAFFRDPERPITDDARAMVSPADGLVSDVGEIENCDLVGGGPAVRIGIFLSVFNVHVNRAPCDGVVASVVYKKGKFINALSHNAASDQNESNTIMLFEPRTNEVVCAVKQIVGLIARRIICTSQTGDVVARGQRIGMIKFGSRTELYIPKRLAPEVRCKKGDKVRGGLDILAVVDRQIAHTGVATSSAMTPEPQPASNPV
ncbi:MAG TPA: phosphatidylserine decarboxylase [Tepidisphaeraceae bacterium]|nr:phosphatidylserine decarboxylase [Tepidisphaeraceae bacterium]